MKRIRTSFCKIVILAFVLGTFISINSCVSVIGIAANATMLANEKKKADNLKNQAQSFGHSKKSRDTFDYKNMCRYFLYRRDKWHLSGITCLIYDNKEYVGFSERKTFIEIDSVQAGEHIFQSALDSKYRASLMLQPKKTYILNVIPRENKSIDVKALKIMGKSEIENELKDEFFKLKFEENNLKLEDFTE